MNFVKNESLSVEKLHSLLQQKSKVARLTAQTYNFIADVVRLMGVNNFLFEVRLSCDIVACSCDPCVMSCDVCTAAWSGIPETSTSQTKALSTVGISFLIKHALSCHHSIRYYLL